MISDTWYPFDIAPNSFIDGQVFFRMFFWIDLVCILMTTRNTSAIAGYIYRCINTRKFKGLDSREIASLPEIKKWFTWHIISIIAENKLHACHKTICIQWKLQHSIIAVFLIKTPLFLTTVSVHLFQSNQCFQVIEFVDLPVPEKL